MESRDAGTAPAWSGVARVVHGGEVIEEVSAGFADGPDGPPCSADLRFQAGSISKLIMSAVVLLLDDSDTLDLDRRIGRWLADAPDHWQAITLRQLIGHTSGMGHWRDVPDLGSSLLIDPPARDDLVAMIARAPLVSAPGDRWGYSGPGFVIAALVIEAATGSDYGAVATDLVLGPAQMRATTSGLFPDLGTGTARGHRGGQSVPVREGFARIPGTGDLWTTAEDLIRLNQALRAGNVLPPAAAARLWTPQTTIAPSETDRVVLTDAYGYGTFLGSIKGSRARINPGDNPGYQSLLAYLPDDDLDLVVLSNDEAVSITSILDHLISVSPPAPDPDGPRPPAETAH